MDAFVNTFPLYRILEKLFQSLKRKSIIGDHLLTAQAVKLELSMAAAMEAI